MPKLDTSGDKPDLSGRFFLLLISTCPFLQWTCLETGLPIIMWDENGSFFNSTEMEPPDNLTCLARSISQPALPFSSALITTACGSYPVDLLHHYLRVGSLP